MQNFLCSYIVKGLLQDNILLGILLAHQNEPYWNPSAQGFVCPLQTQTPTEAE